MKPAETSTTWEHGKFKLTLTRKSGTDARVTLINKDAATRSPHSDGFGFMWSGTLAQYTEATLAFCAFREAMAPYLDDGP